MGLIYKVKGLAKWIGCKRASRTVQLKQLNTCRTCPSAMVGKAFGFLWLTCGRAGDEEGLRSTPPVCGCVLAWVLRKRTREIEAEKDPEKRKALALAAMRVKGKTACVALCDQGKWVQ